MKLSKIQEIIESKINTELLKTWKSKYSIVYENKEPNISTEILYNYQHLKAHKEISKKKKKNH